MSNKFFQNLISLLVVFLLCTANSVFAISLHIPASIKPLAIKSLFAMGGVLIFSIVLYIGLSLYNKFFVDEKIKNFNLRKDSLRSPRDKDEAILMFISKNRLQ